MYIPNGTRSKVAISAGIQFNVMQSNFVLNSEKVRKQTRAKLWRTFSGKLPFMF